MASRDVLKKWIDNFKKSPLVRVGSSTFDRSIASQLFYGKTDSSYDDKDPHGYERFFLSANSLTSDERRETLMRFLHFVGIRLTEQTVKRHLEKFPEHLQVMTQKSYYILKSFAHASNLAIDNPYKDNYGNIDFLVRIETGRAQLSIFDASLPEVYSRTKVPAGYGDDPTVAKFFEAIESSSSSFFISGKAGTGKSTFIHYFTQNTKKNVLLMAFTGIAAVNVGGVTVHSFFRFPLRPMMPVDDGITEFHENSSQRKLIEGIDTILIDEVSMLRADLLQAIDQSLRINGGHPGKPFGGKQIIFVGDLFQLPPVVDNDDEVEKYVFKHAYEGEYFFDCKAYRQVNPKLMEFTHSHRQAEDLEFVDLLDRVRRCEVDDKTLDKLNERVNAHYVPNPKEFNITLTTNNAIADAENGRRLAELPTEAYEFPAYIQGDFERNSASSASVLTLKKDAQVIFTRNDTTGLRRWVNGTIGKVDFVAHDVIDIRLPNGEVCKLERELWENRGYKFDKANSKVTSEVKGTFSQYPVKLAWAITIHKSQGLTFDHVVIDMGSGAFANGQLYTALSRCRKLGGIVLRRKIKHSDVVEERRLIEFYEGLTKI
jgi:ATP-dependent DNA helicase PIF1